MDLDKIYSLYRRILSDILNIIVSITWALFIFSTLDVINLDLKAILEYLQTLNFRIDSTALVILLIIVILFLTPLGLSLNAISYFFLEPVVYIFSYLFFKMNIFFPLNDEAKLITQKLSLKEYVKFLNELFLFSSTFNNSTYVSLAPARGLYIFFRSFSFANLNYAILSIFFLKFKVFFILLLIFILNLFFSILIFNYVISDFISSIKIKYILDRDFKEKIILFMQKFKIDVREVIKEN